MARKKVTSPTKVTLRYDQAKNVIEYFDKLRAVDPEGKSVLVLEVSTNAVEIIATIGDSFKLAKRFYRRDYDD